ncbi:MAG TPA: S41 family peptidase [Phycisphaerales bacterium]|nr:S41 family peptidase [Phycisphaerales bacterium]
MFAALVMMVLAVPPRVVGAVPDHGDSAVSPLVREVRIEFDQDMAAGGWSICGGGPMYPKLEGKPRWETARVLVIPVALEAAHEYRLSINCPAARNTRAATGESAEVTPIWFRTAKDAASAEGAGALTVEVNRAAVEELRAAVDERYAYRDRVVKDWGAVFEEHRGALESARTRGAFAREAARLLKRAEDLHVSLMVGGEEWNVRFGTASRSVPPNVDANTLADVVPRWKMVSDAVQWGRYDDGVVYVAMHECLDAAADEVVAVLSEAKAGVWVKGVVLDLRRNAGGDELAARRVAGVFLDKERVYSRNRNRDPGFPEGWSPVYERVVQPAPAADRLGVPVAVLVGRYCMSSCESLVLMLKGAPRVVTVGERTFGSSGNPRPTRLTNGVTVWLSRWEDLDTDGRPVEGVGVEPDVKIECEVDEFQTGDPVLERGLKEVRVKIDER